MHEEGRYHPEATAAPSVKRERERVDQYLLLPDCDSVGVKQRQGRLEVKALVAGPRPFSLGGVVGRTDQWVKWSYTPSELIAQAFETDLDRSGPWQQVAKTRYLQKYSSDSGRPVAVPPDQRPNSGCIIEFTLVSIMANVEAWFTFGFEAFGRPEQVTVLLNEAVAHFFARHSTPPVVLEGRDSFSYPAWLTLVS